MENKDEEQREFMKFGVEARNKLVEGAQLMYDCVCSTLSPKGRNVAIARNWGNPIVVHDGVTCAREVKSSDRFVQIGVNLIREAATKTNEEAGDGTTTSTLIAYETIVGGMKLLANGKNPMILRSEINEALQEALVELDKISKEAKTQEDLERVASISSASTEIGKMVGETVFKVGVDGLVSVEESGGFSTVVDHAEGMSIDKGWASPYFITNPNRMEAIVDNAAIIITDKKVTTIQEILPIVDYLVTSDLLDNKNIVLIGDVGGQALSTLVQNKLKGIINCVVIKKPGYGEFTHGILEDIAILTGGKVMSKELGMPMDKEVAKSVVEEFVGTAKKVVVGRKNAMIVNGGGDKKEVKAQVKRLKEMLAVAAHKTERETLEERIAKLTSGVSIIKVGAKTDVEGREIVERVKDAVGAAQAALKEGVVPGSGVTFLRLAQAIKKETDGAKLLKEVLEEPLRKVMSNSGEPDKTIRDYITEIKEKKDVDYGYECMEGKLTNLYKAGVIDPTKVIRLCLENAVSVSTMILSTDCIVDYVDIAPHNG